MLQTPSSSESGHWRVIQSCDISLVGQVHTISEYDQLKWNTGALVTTTTWQQKNANCTLFELRSHPWAGEGWSLTSSLVKDTCRIWVFSFALGYSSATRLSTHWKTRTHEMGYRFCCRDQDTLNGPMWDWNGSSHCTKMNMTHANSSP